MGIDESFKKAGTIPFKWEIIPGVPKESQQQNHNNHHHPLPPPPPHQTSPSFRSGSSRWRFEKSVLFRSDESVTVPMGMGCFPSSAQLKKKESIKKKKKNNNEYASSELETPPRRSSFSSRKSFVSPLRERSPSSLSSPLSCRWSPRPISDAEWASFGLF
ncbi:uncharacterized protein LOC115699790 [Cannabis sativa]|uniref:Uncharacterized protein n=1 Tax=Cannabis sativa TaxID=3483 RepID=A0A7J6FR80_CANSA|nr:uncharacterized protein LOC115699790 [Cannabis sativa]KAF4373155.1 hypothetical protein F8388_019337 [Cannabis sativa]